MPGVVSPARVLLSAEAHLLGATVASAFVLVIEKLEMLLTVVMRDARALGLGRGGRTYAAKSSAMNATSARIVQCGFLLFIFGIWNLRCLLPVLRSYLIDTDTCHFVQSKLPPLNARAQAASFRKDCQEPPYADPHVRWCGRREGNPRVILPPTRFGFR